MFSVTVSVCKQLVLSKSFRLIYTSASVKTNGPYNQIEWPPDKIDLTELTKNTSADMLKAVGYVRKINTNENIDWESLTKKLTAENISKPNTKILQACWRLNNVRLAEKFHSYLTKKGYQWTIFDKIFFCKTLLKQKSLIPDYEDMFVSLYKQVQPVLNSSPILQRYLNELFVEVPHLYNNLINNQMSTSSVANKAAELYDIEKAFEIIELDVGNLKHNFFEKCKKACIENASKDSRLSINFMNKLVEVCTKYTVALSKTSVEILKSMFNNLNLCDSNYHWYVQDCTIDNHDICSSCQLALKPNTLSVEEFKEMSDEFVNNVVLKHSHLHSDTTEFKNFLEFIQRSIPYDVVIDALNVMYLKKQSGIEMVHHYLSYFLDEGCNILIVTRRHAKNTVLKPIFVNYKKYEKRLQFFFIQNISNDDVFILYSAFHSGPNTKLVTGDLLRNHSSKLSKINRCRFLRWQMSNQYFTDLYINMGKPVLHCNLPQLTHTSTQQNEKYVWHISHQPNAEILLRSNPVEWICVTATKRK